jgi:8-oxo-dGTP pyrophosphatase MutT (NUDIX family)
MIDDAVVVLLVCDGKAWLARRDAHAPIMPGLLECPGGKVEEGEDVAIAALREVKEESGLALDIDRLTHRGSIWSGRARVVLYIAELGRHERPKDTEPEKRNAWQLSAVDGLKMKACTPALGALASIFMHDLRLADEEA